MSSFDSIADKVTQLKTQPDNDTKLKLYALFKQRKDGDCNTAEPSMFKPTDKAKWKAWNGEKGKSKESAESEYIELANRLIAQDA